MSSDVESIWWCFVILAHWLVSHVDALLLLIFDDDEWPPRWRVDFVEFPKSSKKKKFDTQVDQLSWLQLSFLVSKLCLYLQSLLFYFMKLMFRSPFSTFSVKSEFSIFTSLHPPILWTIFSKLELRRDWKLSPNSSFESEFWNFTQLNHFNFTIHLWKISTLSMIYGLQPWNSMWLKFITQWSPPVINFENLQFQISLISSSVLEGNQTLDSRMIY